MFVCEDLFSFFLLQQIPVMMFEEGIPFCELNVNIHPKKKKVLPLLPCVMGNLKDSLFVCLKKINKAKTHNQCISVKIMPELIGVMASCLSPSAFTYLDLDAG